MTHVTIRTLFLSLLLCALSPGCASDSWSGSCPLVSTASADTVTSSATGDVVELPLVLSSRQVVSGTWEITPTGLLVESEEIQVARVPIAVPVGCGIKGVRVRGIQTEAGSGFAVRLQEVVDDGEPEDIGRQVVSTDGAEGRAQDVVVELDAVTRPNARYFVRIEAVGGSAQRVITGAFVSYL